MTLIHVAAFSKKKYLFLRKLEHDQFQWFIVNHLLTESTKTAIKGSTCTQALQAGYKTWKDDHFRFIHCGFRYTLPDRDQVGSNALFWQLSLSYNSPTGRYFDEEAGHFCFVDFASQEALDLLRRV